MTDLLQLLAPAILWMPACVWIFSASLLIAWLNRPLGRLRWLLAAWILLAPFWFPAKASYAPAQWGMLATLLTSWTIIAAARLPDLDHLLRIKKRRAWTVFVWLTLPVVRLADPERSRRQPRRAMKYLGFAALKKGSWEVLAWGMQLLPASDVPWPVQSALLMLYFLLSLTALHDAVAGLCVLLGFDVDELFDAPLLSLSLRDFWSRRWNKFINRFALKQVALPLRYRLPTWATLLAVFGCSGLFHEYFAWGVGAGAARHGLMMCFFLLQGVAVWLGSKLPLRLPSWLSHALTFVWMALTAPLFFAAVEPALHAFNYPESWLPWRHF